MGREKEKNKEKEEIEKEVDGRLLIFFLSNQIKSKSLKCRLLREALILADPNNCNSNN